MQRGGRTCLRGRGGRCEGCLRGRVVQEEADVPPPEVDEQGGLFAGVHPVFKGDGGKERPVLLRGVEQAVLERGGGLERAQREKFKILPEGAAREKASAPRGGGEHPDGARDDNGRETFDGSVGEGRQQPESISGREEDFRSARESRENGDERHHAEQNAVRGAGTRHADRAGATDVNVRSVLEEGVTYDGTNFFFAVKPQLDEMFVRYPAEDRLNAIVPNSKWVRVDTDEGDYYVLGVLYDLSTPIFICYGIPGMRNVAPPREIADVCVWLPLSADEPDGGGFWIIYQSAENGKCVR